MPREIPVVRIEFAEPSKNCISSCLDIKDISVDGKSIVHVVRRVELDIQTGELVGVRLTLIPEFTDVVGVIHAPAEVL